MVTYHFHNYVEKCMNPADKFWVFLSFFSPVVSADLPPAPFSSEQQKKQLRLHIHSVKLIYSDGEKKQLQTQIKRETS